MIKAREIISIFKKHICIRMIALDYKTRNSYKPEISFSQVVSLSLLLRCGITNLFISFRSLVFRFCVFLRKDVGDSFVNAVIWGWGPDGEEEEV